MISEKLKNRLAVENGEEYSKRRYIDLIVEQGSYMFNKDDELAILRKIVYELLAYIEKVHPDVVNTDVYEEFQAYNDYYEKAKANAKAILTSAGGKL